MDIPESMAKVEQHLSELPAPEDDDLKTKSIEDLCEHYLQKLESSLDSARSAFLDAATQKAGKRRFPPIMRVVK